MSVNQGVTVLGDAVVLPLDLRLRDRIPVSASTQSAFLMTQWVGVRPLYPLLSPSPLTGLPLTTDLLS